MQSKIILIGVTSSEMLFPKHFCKEVSTATL